jgi:ABC-type lipoprotein export system ATPase subunit
MKITLSNVFKYYKDSGKSVKGVENINLSLNESDSFVAVTGESGSGKSTLAKIIAGIEINGRLVNSMSSNEKQEWFYSKVSYVSQDDSLIEFLSAEKNVELALLNKGFNSKNAKEKARDVLDQVGINPLNKKSVSYLSGGERQRISIARALALETELIIFDEPTGNLDQETTKSINALIGSLPSSKTIIYITHEYEEIEKYVTRHIVLKDGSIEKDDLINQVPQKDMPKEETTKQSTSKKKNVFKECLIASSSLTLGDKKGGLLSGLASLFLVLAVLWAAIGYTSLLVRASSTSDNILVSDYYDKTDKTHDAFGNRIVLQKETAEAADPETGTQAYVDYSDYLTDCKVYPMLPSEGEAIKSSQENITFSLNSQAFKVAPYFPFNTTVAKQATTDASGNKASLLIRKPDSTDAQAQRLENLVGQKLLLTFFNNLTSDSLTGKTNGDLALLSKAPEVFIDSLSYSDNPYLEYGDVYLTTSSNVFDVLQENIIQIKTGKTYSDYSLISNSSLLDSPINSITATAGDTQLTMLNGIFDLTQATKIQIPAKYQGMDMTFDFNGLKISSSLLESGNMFSEDAQVVYVDLKESQKSMDDQFYFPSYLLKQDYYEAKIKRSVFFSSDKAAENFSKQDLKGKFQSFYFAPYSQAHYSFSLYALSYEERVKYGWVLLVGLSVIGALAVVLQMIERKINAQATDTETVLRRMGYTRKEITLINFFKYLLLVLVWSIILYCLALSGAIAGGLYGRVFAACPYFVVLSPLVILGVAFFLSLAKKGGKAQ